MEIIVKKFQFRLDTLLNYRNVQEEQAQIVLAEANRLLQQERNTLERLETILNNTIEVFCQKQEQSITADELNLYNGYIVTIKKNVIVQTNKVLVAEKHRFESLKKLEEAMRQRKLVENLRTKQMERHYTEFLREEQNYLDEIGTQISIRGKASVI